ncbi:hypothetical protein FYJ28_12240 [Arthrobacter sp. BL-252-APC-1A]|uniref:hypothetical protein n=1 Tax=Arthrobacter sp. BL-252-APC-1A TaxID=2606622 RepID=UPI0012B2372A|nr:hypothetical protein [Arthrobacter sp. BL-252-APC-1A]MSR99588.1 hypothetical protein [Arthrobacter sp. BL-252-APC-1A]
MTGSITAATLSVALLAGAAPAQANPDGVHAATDTEMNIEQFGESFVENLPASEVKKWEALSAEQQAEVIHVLSDPRVDSISTTEDAKEISPLLDYEEVSVPATSLGTLAERGATTMATTRRNAWTEAYWTILGLRYAEVRTTVNYNTSGGRVVSHNACYANYTNHVPLRTIQGTSYTIYGNGKLTCETAWSIARPLQQTQYGYQGIRVNGYGNIEATWNP